MEWRLGPIGPSWTLVIRVLLWVLLPCFCERGKTVAATCTLYFSLIIVKSLQLRGCRQIAKPRKYCLVRVIIFFDVCFLYLFCFSQVRNFWLNSLQLVSEPRVRFEWEQWQRKQERRLE